MAERRDGAVARAVAHGHLLDVERRVGRGGDSHDLLTPVSKRTRAAPALANATPSTRVDGVTLHFAAAAANCGSTNSLKSAGTSTIRPCDFKNSAVVAIAFATPEALPPPSQALEACSAAVGKA